MFSGWRGRIYAPCSRRGDPAAAATGAATRPAVTPGTPVGDRPRDAPRRRRGPAGTLLRARTSGRVSSVEIVRTTIDLLSACKRSTAGETETGHDSRCATSPRWRRTGDGAHRHHPGPSGAMRTGKSDHRPARARATGTDAPARAARSSRFPWHRAPPGPSTWPSASGWTAHITAALDAGVPLRDAKEAASHADPRTTMRYERGRVSLDRHAT
jgi:hypothetical protein